MRVFPSGLEQQRPFHFLLFDAVPVRANLHRPS